MFYHGFQYIILFIHVFNAKLKLMLCKYSNQVQSPFPMEDGSLATKPPLYATITAKESTILLLVDARDYLGKSKMLNESCF